MAKTSVVKFAKRTAQQAPAQLEQCPLVSLGDFVAAAIIVVEGWLDELAAEWDAMQNTPPGSS